MWGETLQTWRHRSKWGPQSTTKHISLCEPQSTRFETQQTILEYLPKKSKIQIFDRNPDPMFIIETRTKGISITPWPSDYNWITNQKYKIWMPQGRISDKFTVLEEPKEEQSLTFSDFFYTMISLLQWVHATYKTWLKIENIKMY